MTTKYQDAYANLLTGLGTGKDKSTYAGFVPRGPIPKEVLDDIYEEDAIAARVVDRLVDDGTREGFTITGEDEGFDFASVQSQLEDLDAVNAVADAWRWSRLYGGALLVMVVNDGRKMDKPLNLEAANKLSSLQVVESPYARPVGYNPGMGARAFRRPEQYEITVDIGAEDNKSRLIHRSRVIRFDGVRVAPSRMIHNEGWGPSVLSRTFTEIQQLGDVMGYARSIMHDISIQVYKLDGLREKLCGSAQDQEEMRAAVEAIRMAVDNLHVLAMDALDDFVTVDRSVAGIDALINQFIDALVRATPYPRTVILGEQPSGLNTNGDSEIRTYFDFVASQQKLTLTPAITRLLEVIFAVRRNRGEDVPEEWVVKYQPLWQPTEQEAAETFLKNAQAHQILNLNDVESPEEWRAALISAGLITPLETPDDVGTLEEEEEPEEGNDPDAPMEEPEEAPAEVPVEEDNGAE
jgi:phage-related protein (TIGR01555 family)